MRFFIFGAVFLALYIQITVASDRMKCYVCSYDSEATMTNSRCEDNPSSSDLKDCGPPSPVTPWVCEKAHKRMANGRITVDRRCQPLNMPTKCYGWEEEMKRLRQRTDRRDEIPKGAVCFCNDEDGCNGASGVKFTIIGITLAVVLGVILGAA